MATVKEPKAKLLENGREPEYRINRILRHDNLPGRWVRLYCAQERDTGGRVEYTLLCTTDELILMARHAMSIAAEAHNESTIEGMERAVLLN